MIIREETENRFLQRSHEVVVMFLTELNTSFCHLGSVHAGAEARLLTSARYCYYGLCLWAVSFCAFVLSGSSGQPWERGPAAAAPRGCRRFTCSHKRRGTKRNQEKTGQQARGTSQQTKTRRQLKQKFKLQTILSLGMGNIGIRNRVWTIKVIRASSFFFLLQPILLYFSF